MVQAGAPTITAVITELDTGAVHITEVAVHITDVAVHITEATRAA
ncbi:MAG TPA: hypothetical protein VGJ57_00635 [Nitrospirales bacterium]